MKNQKQIDIEILWGLPGCGKSTYAKSICPSNFGNKFRVIDLDKIGKSHSGNNFREKVVNEIQTVIDIANRIILDGLIVDNKSAKALIETIKAALSKRFDPIFHIIWWEADVETCLHNDNGRRELSSEITIRNIPFEKPSSKLLDIPDNRMKKMKVVRKPDFEVWAEKIVDPYYAKNGQLTSSEWCLGGTSGTYTGDFHTIDPEPQPVNFDAFDELLEKVCPNISFLLYKKLYRECVSINQSRNHDYYGGSSTNAQYVCDLNKLYQLIKETGIDI